MIDIKEITIMELFAFKEFPNLVHEYIEESTYGTLLEFETELENYMPLHYSGKFKVFAAIKDDRLVGFINLLSTTLPHHNKLLSAVESIFVGKDSRNTGAGIKLKREAEKYAKSIGAKGVIYSTPLNGSLYELLSKDSEATEISRVFFRAV